MMLIHRFVICFARLSAIMPPIAVVASAPAGNSGGDAFRTGLLLVGRTADFVSEPSESS